MNMNPPFVGACSFPIIIMWHKRINALLRGSGLIYVMSGVGTWNSRRNVRRIVEEYLFGRAGLSRY